MKPAVAALALSFLFAFSAPARELRRETSRPLEACAEGEFTAGLPEAEVYLQTLFLHLARSNPNVFRGDLAPERICIGVKYNIAGGRAQALAESRTIRIDSDLILRAQNDAQMAFVIAHEMAHISMRHFEDEPYENHELEADRTGAHLYLQGGFTADELAWRAQQVAAVLVAAGLTPGVQPPESAGMPAVHDHLPEISAAERIANAYQACNVRNPATMNEPPRGVLRYPSECWTIWDLRHNQPAQSPEYRTLMDDSRALVNLPNTSLAEVKAELRAYVPGPDTKSVSESLNSDSDDPPPPKDESP